MLPELLDPNQNNWQMLGHEWAVNLLKGQLTNIQDGKSSIRHAYLFTGAEGVGRRTLALHFAQALNCPTPLAAGIPCLKCRTCQKIETMQHPDLAIVQAEHAGATLKVDQVRELQHSLALAPYEARYRVALLLRFEEAHLSAANALLKSLEEPPPQVIMLLTASSAESLLPTIVSRCQVIRLRPLSWQTVQDGLQERWKVPLEEAQTLARISDGRPGFAYRLHQDPEALEKRKVWLDDQLELLTARRCEKFAYAESVADFRSKNPQQKAQSNANLRNMLLTWLSFWRDVMLSAAFLEGETAPIINLEYRVPIEELGQRLGLVGARHAAALVERTLERLEHNVNTRMAIEVLLLDMPR
ncbi:MAG: DNA polymerase III subunit delta' [Chloroflexota bacterium]|jgi:DNA polymerase-3 subunit delta'